MASIVLTLVTAVDRDGRPDPITDRAQIRLSTNPRGAKLATCSQCGATRSALAIYRVASGSVCRPCLAHVRLVTTDAEAPAPAAIARLRPSNGLEYPSRTSARRLLQVFDPEADRNLAGAIVLRSLRVTSPAAAAPIGWAA